ncbi:MAG: DNA-3-methyladenine glycosylase 2 family protein [Verrucomicrobia bacterium]|nr:DNA-3-methyladenine glycosylase 2 family protein [Verrucomicrobiota bacterium]
MDQIVSTTIPIPDKFSFKETLAFLDRGFDECLYFVSEGIVSKLLTFPDGDGILRVFQKENVLQIELQKEQVSDGDMEGVKALVSDWFDLNRNITPFYNLLTKHPILSHFVKDFYGSRLVGIPDLYEAICWAIIGQQINLAFAYKVKRSLVEEYGERKVFGDRVYYTFPTPERLAQASRKKLRALKFSRQKIDYLIIISRIFANGEMSKAILRAFDSKKGKLTKLMEIKGIGIWTANYVLMKSMGEMSCITYGDAGLNKAVNRFFDTGSKPDNGKIDDIFKNFAGWESYLNFYLWRSLE